MNNFAKEDCFLQNFPQILFNLAPVTNVKKSYPWIIETYPLEQSWFVIDEYEFGTET